MKDLTTTLVNRGPELIDRGFGEVIVSSNTVITGFKSVCP